MATDYVDLTRLIVSRIVDKPDEVEITTDEQGRGLVIEVSVAETDMGKVIGKGGRNIDAIRAVVRAAGLRHHDRVQVELVEDEEEEEPAVASASADEGGDA